MHCCLLNRVGAQGIMSKHQGMNLAATNKLPETGTFLRGRELWRPYCMMGYVSTVLEVHVWMETN